MLSPSRSFTYAGNTIYCGLHMTLECRTTKLRSLSQCLSPGKESQQEKVHDKSTCGMTPRECASRIKEYKTLRTKDYKTKSRNQQHGNRTVIIKRYSDQEMEIHVCLLGNRICIQIFNTTIQHRSLFFPLFSFLPSSGVPCHVIS
jgi:hypothetical protein